MFYLIKNNVLNSFADYKYDNDCLETDIITQDELREHPNKVIVQNGVLVLNPNYEQEEEEKEAERISHLKCTKRVFVLMLEQLQYDYFETIQPLIETNRQAKLEWELCVELERSNPLLDQLGSQIGITSEQLDNLFKFANGEITQQEFLGE
ncbi:MAG: hypothetical protein MJ180_00175 [Candidatus Gastranaerophilales bacterium]|nr:hypothetical protein [Candidatus Gastranaerophilales bacterium]